MRSAFIQSSAGAISAAILVLALSGCGGRSEPELIADAKSTIEKKDDKAAIVQLKAVLQTNPQSGEARYLLGRALLRTGDVPGAVVELEKARDLKQRDDEVLPVLAEALLSMGQAKKVIDAYGNVTLTDPKAAATLKTVVAGAYASQGNLKESAVAVDAALLLDPKNVGARLMQAHLIARRGAFDEAMTLVSSVIADEPKRTAALQLRGDLLFYGKSDLDAAGKAFSEVLVIDPRYVPAHSALIRLLLQKGDVKGFRAQIAELKKAVPNHPEARFYDVQLALIDKDFARAREGAQQLLRMAPDNPLVLQLVGAVEFQTGALKSAESHFNKALQLSPKLPLARRLLAETYLRAGQAAKTLAVLQPVLEQPQPSADLLALAAQAYLQNGDLAKSEIYFNLAAKADPGDPKARTALALAQVSKGNTGSGFAQLEAVASADKSTYADLALISARLQRGDTPAALKAVDRLESKLKDKPLPHLLRGQILLMQKDLAGARASFDKALALDPVHFPAVKDLATIDLAEKKPDEARKRFEALLTRDPKNYLVMLAVAELRQSAGEKPEKVEALLVDAVKFNPSEAAPRLMLIENRLARRQAKAAIATAQEALALLPDNLQLQDALGRSQLASGDIQQAISTFSKVAVAHPAETQPLLRLADAYIVGNDHAAATQSLRRALLIKPDLLAAQRGLVQIAMAKRRTDEALQVAMTVQKQRPKEPVGYLMEGEIHLNRRDLDRASAAFQAVLERDRSTANALRVHALYAGAGRAADAERFAVQWLREQPRDSGFLFHLGTSAMERKDYPAAEARYRQVLALEPTNASTLNNLSWLLVQQGKPGAVELAEKANALLPNQALIMDTLSTALAAEKQLTKAIDWQKRAVAAAPDAPAYRLNLARLLISSGDRSGARVELDKLAALGQKFSGQAEVASLLKTL